jgi:hypothetical protein
VLRSHGLDREDLKAVLRQHGTMDLLQHLYYETQVDNPRGLRRSTHSATEEVALDAMRRINIVAPDDPPRLAIPAFANEEMRIAANLYRRVTAVIVERFMAQMPVLKQRIAECSFSQCLWSDISCMLFHLAYSYAADTLVEKGTIPEFPQSAGGEWGVWL